MSNTSKTAIVRDLDFHWANLTKSHSPFGTEVWDVQIRTTNDDTAKELSDLGVAVKKHDEGYFFANVKRKTVTSKGDKNTPVMVVDANKQPVTEEMGNGSKGHIKLFSYEYSTAGRSGVAAQLSAIQVVDFVEYKRGGDDFDIEETSDPLNDTDF